MIGVSSDTQARNDEFRQSLELPFALVGDPTSTVIGAYGVKFPFLGKARRVTFLIGRDRRIESVHTALLDGESHVATTCKLVFKK